MSDRHPGHDLQLNGMIPLLHDARMTSEEKTALIRSIEARIARVAQGASMGRGTMWEKRFQEIDKDLRLRLLIPEGPGEIEYEVRKLTGQDEPDAYWVVDRWVEQWQCWAEVLHICDTQGDKPKKCEIDESWVQRLRRADMQAAGNAYEYMKQKREAADLVQKQNRSKADDAVLAAVDSLSTKQLDQMVEVERAMHTGEKIEARGSDERFLDKVWRRQKKGIIADVPQGQSINPGMHPRLHRRTRRK